ncbi:TolB family protein [Tepidibacter hydrothermalis]|uniref:TolB protein n=1 Tax=Tepidibacter hydrothermalis TaxID=3036126 RepID=A0ABY8EEC9_9FIRM|nr:hypothetical protein [Tepidibacter hydrothermalis]WFD11131.1 hypothetical protein P4S50_03380 [Tepidibacter hydrothermalis]
MKKRKLSIYLVLISTLLLFVGCTKDLETDREIIKKENKEITVIADTNYTVGKDIVEKINVYEGLKGYDWVENDKIIGIKENENNKLEKLVYDVKDILNFIKKEFTTENLPYQYINVSPDKKHIFFVDSARHIRYIIDLNGNIKAKAEGPYIGELGEAIWINNKELIMPYKGTGFYIINLGGKEIKIEDVEDKEYIYKAVKVGNKIYYSTQIELERKMKVYNISTKETKLFIEDRVVDFHLSPKDNQFVIETHNLNKDKTTVSLVDLEGKNKDAVAEGRMIYGTSWSPDGSKLAYILNSRGEEDEGLFIIDIEKKKKNQVSTTYLDLENHIKWSPSGNKIMISNSEVKDSKWVDKTNVINLK